MPAPNPVRNLIRKNLLRLVPFGAFTERIEHADPFRHRPILAADLDPSTINQAAVRLLTGANRAWSLAGTNAANAGSSLHDTGGVRLATADTLNDQMILQPAAAINSVEQSAFRRVKWSTDAQVRFEAIVSLAAITAVRVKVGLALTNAVNRTTDDDQAGFMFDTAGSVSAANWTAIQSVGGTDTETDTGRAAVADDAIRLGVTLSSARTPRFYVNGVKVHTGPAMAADKNLIPFIAIQTLGAAVRSLDVFGLRISRTLVAAA